MPCRSSHDASIAACRPAAGIVMTFVILLATPLAGCADRVAGPEANVLVGAYGSTERPDLLRATRAGVELDQLCSTDFVSSEPLALDASGTFRVAGRYHQFSLVQPTDRKATLTGHVQPIDGMPAVVLTLTVDVLDGALLDPYLVTLRLDERYPGIGAPCPA